ncbi:hypothetical protein [Nocardia xishanensis]|uniref:hypothetical protein n=1 Tax=Nocardia xishanensis TaxID=238964 RepID=UPI00082EF709|nr:hypothetical protein [Nocardia xishanensis]
MDGNDNSANRILWSELPGVVRAEVEDRLGARVRAATTQPGGFSHGLAARLEIGDRRGVFAKAIPTDDGLAAMYRTELETAARLPPTVPTPALRFGLDTHGWLVAVFDYVPGRHPRIDRPDELSAILATVEQLAITLTPGPLPDLPTIAQDYGRPTTRLVIQPQAPPRTSCTIGEFGDSLGIDLRLAGRDSRGRGRDPAASHAEYRATTGGAETCASDRPLSDRDGRSTGPRCRAPLCGAASVAFPEPAGEVAG